VRRLSLGRRKTAGFSMIEVLITLVVLAFGLLGLGLLQTLNLRYTKSANQRTQAVNLSGELLDMMRSNRSEIAAYALPETSLSTIEVPCGTEDSLGAASNLNRWKCEVRETLGADAKVSVQILDAAKNSVRVEVQWDENKLGPDDTKVTLDTQL
jgi:type IV pilus assembly protein PilV